MQRLAACLVLLAAAACNDAQSNEQPHEKAAKAVLEIHVATAREEQRPVALTLDGTLVADAESSVTSVVSGRVVEVFVERGSKVQEGAPIIKLRDTDYRLQARSAKAQLQQARARIGGGKAKAEALPDVEVARADKEQAERELARSEQLAASGAVSAQQLELARTRVTESKNRYDSALNQAAVSISSVAVAREALAQANTMVAESTVRAPFSGEIAERMISVGEFVAQQTPLVTLVRTDPLRIELSVPQQHLSAVQPGQIVSLTVDALPDRTFEATVRYVSAAVQRDTRALSVEAVVPNADGVLRPGLFATARLLTGGQDAVSVVPAQAVRTEAGVSRVFVVKDGLIEERVVSVAERTSEEVVVAEGLAAGEQVAIDAIDRLADNVQVKVIEGEG